MPGVGVVLFSADRLFRRAFAARRAEAGDGGVREGRRAGEDRTGRGEGVLFRADLLFTTRGQAARSEAAAARVAWEECARS